MLNQKISFFIKSNKQIIYFIVKVLIIFIIWKTFQWILGEEKIPVDNRLIPIVSECWEHFNDYIRIFLLKSVALFFKLLGYKSIILFNYELHVIGLSAIAIGNYCIGIQLWVYFMALIISYYGKWKIKLLFITIGIICINIINIFRQIGLIFAFHYFPKYMNFNHDYIFNGIVYIFTFTMFYIWIKFYSKK